MPVEGVEPSTFALRSGIYALRGVVFIVYQVARYFRKFCPSAEELQKAGLRCCVSATWVDRYSGTTTGIIARGLLRDGELLREMDGVSLRPMTASTCICPGGRISYDQPRTFAPRGAGRRYR